jgi:hypothetical protein
MNETFCCLGITTPIFGFSHCRDVVVAVSKAGGMGVYGTAAEASKIFSNVCTLC